jgi:hypothetical protein
LTHSPSRLRAASEVDQKQKEREIKKMENNNHGYDELTYEQQEKLNAIGDRLCEHVCGHAGGHYWYFCSEICPHEEEVVINLQCAKCHHQASGRITAEEIEDLYS